MIILITTEQYNPKSHGWSNQARKKRVQEKIISILAYGIIYTRESIDTLLKIIKQVS